MSLFVLYIPETVGRNFASKVHTVIQQVFIRNVSWRFYAKSKFCICFEVHIPVAQNIAVFLRFHTSVHEFFTLTIHDVRDFIISETEV